MRNMHMEPETFFESLYIKVGYLFNSDSTTEAIYSAKGCKSGVPFLLPPFFISSILII